MSVAVVFLWACEEKTGSARKGPTGPEGKQILFGDLHAHTTFSLDAFLWSLPAVGGGGVSPPTQACNFARFCSQLDFWSINDHAEFVTPAQWKDTKQAIRACNDSTGGNGSDPDMVSYLGWEWSQIGNTPEEDYGHKNVVLLDTADEKTPTRPIPASGLGALSSIASLVQGPAASLLTQLGRSIDPDHVSDYVAMGEFLSETAGVQACPDGVDVRSLPPDCREFAADPATLFEKLTQWGFESQVIPHGTSWGLHHPPLANWSIQTSRMQHDPERQRLIEIYSGHGNSEEYRSWEPYKVVDGKTVCPEPTKDYFPCCWQAGEIMRKTTSVCEVEPTGEECSRWVEGARQDYIKAGTRGHRAFPDVKAEEWLDCGQCRDCFQPDFNYTPKAAVQAVLAGSDPSDPANPVRFKFGIIGSTDEHRAAPGSGYREMKRFSDINGPAEERYEGLLRPLLDLGVGEWERQGSYWYTGALAAVHSEGRSRRAIWDALKRREVYGTSGDRMLLWFYLVNGPGGKKLPMGSEIRFTDAPVFEATALGAFKQAPGCPDETIRKAPAGFIENKCFGECYNPTDQRHLITRIEVVRIRPQARKDEPMSELIDDPWKVIPCAVNPEGCTLTFEDPDYPATGRPALYYVRAIQEPTLQFNAAEIRCSWDDKGNCVSTKPCYPDYRGKSDDCMASDEERAWSSPIFLER